MKNFSRYVMASLVVFALACVAPSPVTVVNNNNNSVSVSINFAGSGVESAVPGCPAIKQIQIDYEAEVSIATTAKEPAAISATPRGADGKERKPECDDGDGLRWSYSRQAFTFGSDTAFVTWYKGLEVGIHVVDVRVGEARGTVTVKVVK